MAALDGEAVRRYEVVFPGSAAMRADAKEKG